MQKDMVLEQQLRVVSLTGCGFSIYETSKPTSTVAHFLEKGHTYSNKTTPPRSVTPFGAIFFQTTTLCDPSHSCLHLLWYHYYNISQLWSLPRDNTQFFCLEIGGKENWLWGQPGSYSQVLSQKTGSKDLIIGYNLVVECRHSICKAMDSITQSIDQNKALSIKHFIIVTGNGPLQTYL